MQQVSPQAIRHRQILRDDFLVYAKQCLKIRPKEGDIVPFELNRAQKHVHGRFEDQLKRNGRVRAIILKGRQQGISTYVEGRFYWKTTHRYGAKAFILAHESKSTNALYTMANRFHEHCPPLMKPSTGKSNARELVFDILDSGYELGTAGNDSVGRSQTIQYFHGSEVAFWPLNNSDELVKGILQAIPLTDNTEVVYESTANGMGNFFHRQTIKAMQGDSDFELIFVPWYWQGEYKLPIPINVEWTEEEREYLNRYSNDGLTQEHLIWRRAKIVELDTGQGNPAAKFKQEYPFSVIEAFQYSGEQGIINPNDIHRCRKTEIATKGNLIVGVDPSRGGDRFTLVRRNGRKLHGMEAHTKGTNGGEIKLGDAVSICKKVLDNEKPAMMFIDYGAGADLVDRLHELGYTNVKAVPFGGKPLNPDKYKNKRAEMIGELAAWLSDEDIDVDIPDNDELEVDFLTPRMTRDSADRIQIESKESIKARGLPSTDWLDASALTFAEAVIANEDMNQFSGWYPDQSAYE